MARARNIKPSFFTNDELAEVQPLGRLLFVGLWTIADREGRLEDRPKKIKAEILPYDSCNIGLLLNELQSRNFILRYEANGLNYIQVLTFTKHQNPHIKESESTIPAPDLHHAHQTSTVLAPDLHDTSPADSLLLIPDSLNPSTTLSGKPDVHRLNGEAKIAAKRLLVMLNEKTGRSYRPVDANLNMIVARLKDFTEQELRGVIVEKCEQWIKDEKMVQYLRPATLFAAKNCAQYIGELPT